MHLLLRPEIIDCNSIVAAQFPIAVGAALANRDTPVVCVAGDGATNTGAFFESLNVAARHSLPVLFVIEDNGVQITTPYQSTSNSSVREKGAAFRVPVAAIDEFDLEQADMVVKQSVLNLERGPALLHVNVKRCGAHMMSGVSEFEAPPVIWEDRAARYAYEAYVMETRKLCLRSEVKIDG
jgi:pyruvate dehydrogenase E1 component alpha subunit